MLAVVLLACHGSKPPGDDGPPTDTGEPPPPPVDACDDRAGESFCDGEVVVVCDDAGDVLEETPCAATATCVDGACVPCESAALVLEYARAGATAFHLDVDPAPAADRLPWLRAIDIGAEGTLALAGPVAVYAADGSALADGAPLVAGDRVLVEATAVGSGTIGLVTADCDAELTFTANPARDVAGRPLDGAPWFETPNLFSFEDDDISVLVDPVTWDDRVGASFDAYVVPYRPPADWLADPTIRDAVAGPVEGTVPEDAEGNALPVWTELTAGPALAEPYSVVVDFGRDGQLDPGDLVDGWDAPGAYVSDDLSAPGPYTPTSLDVSYSTWHTFLVYWPVELDTLAPMPLVVISHGNGHDYTWYDYLGNHFASYGYVVVVHTNDTADTSIEPAATTTWENTDVFLENLADIGGGVLDGHVDSHRIAWIGHSRGGEGVVMAYNWLETGQIAPQNFTASDIALVTSIAPTVWTSPEIANPLSVPVYTQLDGSADGDVTGGVDSDIVEYFRIFQGHTQLQGVVYVQGATHNDFNCCGFDDGAGIGPGPLIGRPAAQQIARAYLLAELRAVFEGEAIWWEYLSRVPERFVPPGVETPVTVLLERADGDRTFVIDDFQAEGDLAVSSSGGGVSSTVEALAEGALDDADSDLTASQAEPFNGFTWSEQGDALPERGAVFEWAAGTDEHIEWELVPDAADWSTRSFLSFRACQRTRHPYTTQVGGPLSFTVEVEDADGTVASIDFGAYGGINAPFARDGLGNGVGWVNEFQTVRVPVADFAAVAPGLDLTHLATLRFRFGAAWGSEEGAVGIDDVTLLEEVLP